MQQPDKIDRIVRELLEEARRDYIGLWHIATIVRREFGFIEGDEVRTEALLIVARLLEGGLWPGDYSRGGFQFWAQKDVDAVLARIGGEWVTDNGDPSLEKPICWFAARSDQA